MMLGFLDLRNELVYDQLVDQYSPSSDKVVTGVVENYEFTGAQDRIRALTKCSLDLSLLYTNLLMYSQPKRFDYLKKLPQALVAESCFILTELF